MKQIFILSTDLSLLHYIEQIVFNGAPLSDMKLNLKTGVLGGDLTMSCLITQENVDARVYTTCTASGMKYLSAGEGFSLSVNPKGVRVYMSPEYTYFGAFLVGL